LILVPCTFCFGLQYYKTYSNTINFARLTAEKMIIPPDAEQSE